MKLSIKANTLANLLNRLSGIPTKTGFGATEHVAITVGTTCDSVTISATDIDTWGHVYGDGIVGESGTAVVSFAMLLAFARTQGDRNLLLEAPEPGRVVISAGKTKAVLPSLHRDDFPQFPDLPPTGQVDMVKLVGAIRQAKYAASEDSARPNLCGVYVGKDHVGSTDGHRAVMVMGDYGLTDVLIPVKFAGVLERQFGKATSVDYALGDGKLVVSTPEATFGTRLTDGQFPNIADVLPKFECSTILNRVATIDALKAAGVIGPKDDKIRFQVTGRSVLLSAVGNDTMFDHELDGGDWDRSGTVWCNYRYLLEAFQTMTADNIEIGIKDTLSPMLLRDGQHTHIVMPMRG